MLSMDIVAIHHAVLGISILPDLATVRSYCNGLTVTRVPTCERCVKLNAGISNRPSALCVTPLPYVKHGYRCHIPCGARDIDTSRPRHRMLMM